MHAEATLHPPEGAGEDFLELSMSFATVSLFGIAFPPVAALALLNNAFEARTDSFKFLRAAQRPCAAVATHTLGVWKRIMEGICYLAIFTNAMILCHTSRALPRLISGGSFLQSSDIDLTQGGRYWLFLILEHLLLVLKLLTDGLIPDVPASRMQSLAKDRKLLDLAEASRARAYNPPPPLPSGLEVDAATAAAAVDQAQDDVDEVDPLKREEKMSDLGLLRSFRPVREESLGAADDLNKKLREAAPGAASKAGGTPEKSEKSEKSRKKQLKARRALISELSWTPLHAFARASAKPACTDVVCLLPLLLLWLVQLAGFTIGWHYGMPPRLLWGVGCHARPSCATWHDGHWCVPHCTARQAAHCLALYCR